MGRTTALLALTLAVPGALAQTPHDAETLFELKVRPVLADTCFPCHGGKKVSGGLRVDGRAALLRGGDSGPAIVPGDPNHSLLVQAVRHSHERLRMPPGRRLPAETAADLAAWVQQGAVWPATPARASSFVARQHWAFQPVRPVQPPPDPSGWSDQPIDRFILARLRAEGLQPVGPADKYTLLRRATFDLTGLPPTPEEIHAFLADDSPQAFARVVERLLASPHYGERWGRHWMDLVRYADTAGDNADYPIPEARLYRDYIIASFNRDRPYDQFVREQLAGDLLAREGPPERYAEQVAATGFLALSRRYATGPYELWHLTLENTIATTGEALLGLTLRCARCHDHKFDPVTQKDYYALYAFFAATTFPYGGSEEFASKGKPRANLAPLLPPAEVAARVRARRDLARRLQEEVRRLEAAGCPRDRLGPLQAALGELQRPGLPPDVPVAYAVSDGKPVPVHLHRRGEPDNPGPVVPRGVPAFLAGPRPLHLPADGSGRLELARWLTDPSNPLTARVLVNRVWQHHFGRGLVETPSNFGLRGAPPTHPELLDYLAGAFVEGGWSIKRLHRLIMLSKTYQLASTSDPEALARDPANRWHWRFHRRRLEAEEVRDALLFVSGRLDLRRPGPHPFPPPERWHWTQHDPFKDVYPSNSRSVYLMTQRLQRHPFLGLFDGPDTNVSTGQRSSSTVPLQALYLLNNPFPRAQAEGLARRLIAAGPNPSARLEQAYERAWGRPPTCAETAHAADYLRRYRAELAEAGVPADRLELEAWSSLARVLLTANEFIYVD